MATPEEIEKAKAIAEQIEKQFAMKEHGSNLRNARYILLVLGILNIIGILWYTFGPTRYTGIVYTSGPIAATFIALFFTSKSNPIISVAAGLGIYVFIHTLSLIIEPNVFLRGSIWKLMTIVLLVLGLIAAIKMKRDRPETEVLDSVENEVV